MEETQEKSLDKKMPPPLYVWGDIKDEEKSIEELPSGHKSEIIRIDGLPISTTFAKSGRMPDLRITLPQLKRLDAREDDVLICAFPKAGTHWLWEITKMLRKGKAEYDIYTKETAMLEFHTPEYFGKFDSPRTLNTHLLFRQLPQQMITKKCKMIYIQRNPKDVAVSFYNHSKVFREGPTWEDIVLTFGTDISWFSWYDYTLDWEKVLSERNDLNILSMFYEDLKQDPIREIQRLAAFLEVECEDGLAEKIKEKCDFKNLKSAHETKTFKSEENKKTEAMLYRKGQVGDWKDWFTVAQNEIFDAEYEEKMKNSKLKFTYEA